ncbi:MAG: hypothetical protein II278_08725 [Bacteroidaceae bacterium]|nr:hypothetical protein [Bacteroidaceae bacterium]
MRKIFLMLCMVLVAIAGRAQKQFEGMWQCEALGATMVLNLAEKNIALKDFEGEETYGYLKGELNGTWVILKVKEVKDNKALVRMVSDIGHDAQDVELKLTKDGTIEFKLIGEQNIKTIVKQKYAKLPKVSVFKKNV